MSEQDPMVETCRILAPRYRAMAVEFRSLNSLEMAHRCELTADGFEQGYAGHLRGYPPIPEPAPDPLRWDEALRLLRDGKRVRSEHWPDGFITTDSCGRFFTDQGEWWSPSLLQLDGWWTEVKQ